MIGLILCGGQSQRMGKDKGLLQYQETNWVKIAASKMSSLDIPVKISVNKQQLSSYTELFSKSNLIVDDLSLSIKGPLLGIMSCHLPFSTEDLFVLACDMLNMETDLLRSLCKKYQQQNSDAYIFSNDGNAEPLCGIYTAKGLSQVLNMYKTKKLHKHSMKFILEQLSVCEIALNNEEKKHFKNFNTPDEIKG